MLYQSEAYHRAPLSLSVCSLLSRTQWIYESRCESEQILLSVRVCPPKQRARCRKKSYRLTASTTATSTGPLLAIHAVVTVLPILVPSIILLPAALAIVPALC